MAHSELSSNARMTPVTVLALLTLLGSGCMTWRVAGTGDAGGVVTTIDPAPARQATDECGNFGCEP
jgi:hypothetical protein